ncbi:MAG: FAD:protein FMN transferase, partial [Desulfomonilaceae bacterium]
MRMFIEGYSRGIIQPETCRKAAQEAIEFLEQIAEHRVEIQAPGLRIPEPSKSLLIHEMWQAVCLVGDEDLTPMAAVAGTIADATADFLESQGLTKVVVNNGGDVALRLMRGETATVGIRPEVNGMEVTRRVLITSEMDIGGICTSGLGGRSFTRGVASAA